MMTRKEWKTYAKDLEAYLLDRFGSKPARLHTLSLSHLPVTVHPPAFGRI